ncbi:hypothetical protein STEG23_006106 [Scotinomys teguina]
MVSGQLTEEGSGMIGSKQQSDAVCLRESAWVQDLTGPEHSDSSPDVPLPVKRHTAGLSPARHRPTQLEIRLAGFSRPAPRHGMMSWELPLSEMKGMRHSPLALGSPAGAPREKAADPAAQSRPGKACSLEQKQNNVAHV